jgi:short-subunit dehydrogenase
MTVRLGGARALLTGANGGLGRAIARELAGRSCQLILTARRGDALEGLASELGPPARWLTAELTSAAGVRELIAGAGHVDVLIANATSGNGPVYTATKWGLRGFGLALRQELHGTGVGASTIFPGPIRDAGMFARTGVALPRGTRTSSPEDVARAVARAIERDLAEVEVASASVRLSAALSRVAPVLAGDLARRAGAGRVRDAMIAARAHRAGTRPTDTAKPAE